MSYPDGKNAFHHPLTIKYSFTGSAAADALIKVTGLYIKLILWDGEKKAKTEYTFPIAANRSIAPRFKRPADVYEEYLSPGVSYSYELPETDASPYAMRLENPITVTIPEDLNEFLTFDAATKTFYWIDDIFAGSLGGSSFTITITLYNERDDKKVVT